MEKLFGQNDPEIIDYVEALFHPEDSILMEIRERSDAKGLRPIHVGKMDGLHLEVLTRSFQARKIVEIGTLAGLSGVCLLRGAGPSGKLYTFEYEPHHAEVARESFKRAGLSTQAEIFVGPALENLPKIEKQGPFDLVFIDADKENYPNYFTWAEKNLRSGGVILGDNTFAWGRITENKFQNSDDEKTIRGLQEFNRLCATSKNFRSTILPTGEGLTLAVKR